MLISPSPHHDTALAALLALSSKERTGFSDPGWSELVERVAKGHGVSPEVLDDAHKAWSHAEHEAACMSVGLR